AGDSLDSVFMASRLNEYFGAKSRYRLPMGSNVMTMPLLVSQRLNHPAHIVHLKEKDTYEFIREVRKCALSGKDKDGIDRLFTLIEDQQIFPFFEKIEGTKRTLSDQDQAMFNFDYPDLEITETFALSQFINWASSTKEKIFAALDECLNSAGLKPEQVDLVCLTGGTAKVPFIQEEFARRFGKERLQTQAHFHSVLSGLTESAGFWAQGQKVV
ncbi:MAG TPA: Hsp70 family protein, partial [Bdellovibrio sp.]